MESDIVSSLFERSRSIHSFLADAGEISFASDFDEVFRKSILLAAASFFESQLNRAIRDYASSQLSEMHPLSQIIVTRFISRQYHTWFDWDKRDANKFFTHFGSGFSRFVKSQIEASAELESAIIAFMEIGSARNALVHQNFASFVLDKTVDEIFEAYKTGLPFVNGIYDLLVRYSDFTPQLDESAT